MTISQQQIEDITLYWREGVSKQAICEMVGITPRKFDALRKTHLSHLESRGRGWGGGNYRRPAPTQAEIEERAAEVRSRWTPEMAAERYVGAIYHRRISLQEERSPTLPDPDQ